MYVDTPAIQGEVNPSGGFCLHFAGYYQDALGTCLSEESSTGVKNASMVLDKKDLVSKLGRPKGVRDQAERLFTRAKDLPEIKRRKLGKEKSGTCDCFVAEVVGCVEGQRALTRRNLDRPLCGDEFPVHAV